VINQHQPSKTNRIYLRAFVEVENKENTLFTFSLDVTFFAVAAGQRDNC